MTAAPGEQPVDGPAGPPPRYPTTKCRSCPARIFWAAAEGGGRVPVDEDPVAVHAAGTGNGELLLTHRGDGVLPLARKVRTPGDLFGRRWAWRSHLTTCPYAGYHRGGRRGRTERRSP